MNDLYRLWRLGAGETPAEPMAKVSSAFAGLEYAFNNLGPGRYQITEGLSPLITFQLHLESFLVMKASKEVH